MGRGQSGKDLGGNSNQNTFYEKVYFQFKKRIKKDFEIHVLKKASTKLDKNLKKYLG